MKQLVLGYVACALWFSGISYVQAESLIMCATIENISERLACYDRHVELMRTTQTGEKSEEIENPLHKRIKQEEMFSIVGDFVIVPHRPTYIMPISYVADVNTAPLRESFGNQVDHIQNIEAKYQLSFKVPLWLNVANKEMSLWFAYTQLSLWQLYNAEVSSPFRETSYEPELALAIDTDFKLFGMNNTFVVLGLNHQSNGQSEPLSRSWNRIYATFVLERKNIVAYLKPWYRLPEDADNDDNPDIDKYLGYGELSLFYKRNKRITGLRLWNNLRGSNNRTSVQLDWNFPIKSGFKGYVQYFNGYGETLVDYNFRTKRIGFGIMLTDWF